MYKLMQTVALTWEDIPHYMWYTSRVHQYAIRYEWESVLVWDREYRRLQAEHDLVWGEDISHLTDCHLVDRRFSTGLNKQAPAKGKQVNHTKTVQDPKSGVPICLNFNRGQCLYQNCKFKHVCSSCFGDHTVSFHDAKKPSLN